MTVEAKASQAIELPFDWADAASRVLRGEMARAGLTNGQLAKRLVRLGVDETEASIKNKVYRGAFSLAFFMQCLQAMGVDQVDVRAILPAGRPKGVELDVPAPTPQKR